MPLVGNSVQTRRERPVQAYVCTLTGPLHKTAYCNMSQSGLNHGYATPRAAATA